MPNVTTPSESLEVADSPTTIFVPLNEDGFGVPGQRMLRSSELDSSSDLANTDHSLLCCSNN